MVAKPALLFRLAASKQRTQGVRPVGRETILVPVKGDSFAVEHSFGGKHRRLFFIWSRSKAMFRNCGFPRAVSTPVENELALLPKISALTNRSRQLVPTAASYPPAPGRSRIPSNSPPRAAGEPFQFRIPRGLDVAQPEANHPANLVMGQMPFLTPVVNCPKRDLEMCCKLAFRQNRVIRCRFNGCRWLNLHGIICGRLDFRVDDFGDGSNQAGN